LRFFPQITIPEEKLWYPPIDRKASNIWTAYCGRYLDFCAHNPNVHVRALMLVI
jgi:hypothetical protein